MPIDPNRLTELRKRKRLSRAQLAERSRISLRQIARLESGAAAQSKARDRTINELARTLGVDPDVLTGEMPMPPASVSPHREGGRSRQVSAQLRPEVSLAYTLLKKRYGVNLTTLVNAAPLMFVLLAESSFAWRREKLKEAEDAAGRLRGFESVYPAFQIATIHTDNGTMIEQESIENRDLFGEIVRSYSRETLLLDGVDDSNPFAEYLRDLAAKIANRDVVEIYGFLYDQGTLKRFPEFAICNGDVDEFTGADKRLNFFLRIGMLRVDHMPEELLADGAVDRRREWLEERLDEQLKELSVKDKKFWKDLLSGDLASREAEGEGATP